MKIKLDL